MKDLVIEAKNDLLWKGDIITKIDEKINYIDKNYDDLLVKIQNNVKKCKDIVENTIDEIAINIKEGEK